MATDIILDDGTGNIITLSCDELRTSAQSLVLDHGAANTGSGGTRRALGHSEDDALELNVAGDYPGGVRVTSASLNLRVIEQRQVDPELPARAEIGDMILVRNRAQIPRPGGDEMVVYDQCSLWLCVGYASSGHANWVPFKFAAAIQGTI